MSGEAGSTIAPDLAIPYQAWATSYPSSRNPFGRSYRSELDDFLTLKQQTEIRAALEPYRRGKLSRFLPWVPLVLDDAGASNVREALTSVIRAEGLEGEFYYEIEEIRKSDGDILDMFAYPAIIQYLQNHSPRPQY